MKVSNEELSFTDVFLFSQRRSQFLKYRRLYMDVEREQAKEHQRRKKHLRRIARCVFNNFTHAHTHENGFVAGCCHGDRAQFTTWQKRN